jgi:hypothetical protein
MKRLAMVGLALLAWAGAIAPATPQGQYLEVEGWVQWVAAQRLPLVLDNGLSISVDLSRVPQDQYQGLGPGSRGRLSVVGVVSPDNRRLIATSVTRVQGLGTQAP